MQPHTSVICFFRSAQGGGEHLPQCPPAVKLHRAVVKKLVRHSELLTADFGEYAALGEHAADYPTTPPKLLKLPGGDGSGMATPSGRRRFNTAMPDFVLTR